MRPGYRVILAVAIIFIGGASGFFAARFARIKPTQGLVDTAQERLTPGSPRQPLSQDEPTEDNHPAPARTIPFNVPNISLTDADGVKHSLSEWKGRSLVINFWATWCAPCRREIPLLKSLRHERAGEGVEVIGIAVDFRDAVQHYAREMGIDYPVLVGEQDGLDAMGAFGMDTVFPFTVFADAQGRIVTLKVGELHADDARLILDKLQGVNQGRIGLDAAKKAIADGVAALAARRAQAEETNGYPRRDR